MQTRLLFLKAAALTAFAFTAHAVMPLDPMATDFSRAANAKRLKVVAEQGAVRGDMSFTGQLASEAVQNAALSLNPDARQLTLEAKSAAAHQRCVGAKCPRGRFRDPDAPGIRSGQAETSIAVDKHARNIVIGFNDGRGFSRTDGTVSVSGFQYSSDGGRTFTDGGQLPTGPITELRDAAGNLIGRYPQVFGDPELKYLNRGNMFIYASILVTLKPNPAGQLVPVQTMGFHRSKDGGRTWEGPFEIPSASNPNGRFDADGQAIDAADKEFLDVDPDTGRVIMSWSNFTDTSIEIRTTYSDDVHTGKPEWSKSVIVANAEADGQASIPRFAGNGSQNTYVAWRRFDNFYENSIAFARSTDNGKTWSAPAVISNGLPNITGTPGTFVVMDYVLGNDRTNASPAMAVDTSSSRNRGNVYVVYAAKTTAGKDGSDIIFQKSTDQGQTFSTPVALNARPQQDRGQWFPWVAVDDITGRIWVMYYDQGIADTGDLTQMSFTYSDDGGNRWSKPAALSKTFRAGHGNDTSQPNLGDYNQAVAQGLELFATWAGTEQPLYTDGLPTLQLLSPDVVFERLNIVEAIKPSLSIGNVSVKDSGNDGFINAGDTIEVKVPLFNDVTNPLNASTVPFPVATLSTSTPGVSPLFTVSSYPSIAPGATHSNSIPFRFRLSPSFVPGTPIDFNLDLLTAQGFGRLKETVQTGKPVFTTLFAEDFEGVAAGALPAGWVAAHGAGRNIVPWTSRKGFCADNSTNSAFHINAEDGPPPVPPATSTNSSRWERLISPSIAIPADAAYLQVEFDVCYDTEEDPIYSVLAYDGLFLRLTDVTSPTTVRSILAEAVGREFSTGDIEHYPRHLIRSSNPNYFEDMSVWAGSSGGKSQRVRLTVPGAAGRTIQLRFEYTQDPIATCADLRPGATCGVSVDNIKVQAVKLQ